MTQSLFESIGISLAPTSTTPDEVPAKKTKKAAGGKTIKRQEVTMEAYFLTLQSTKRRQGLH